MKRTTIAAVTTALLMTSTSTAHAGRGWGRVGAIIIGAAIANSYSRSARSYYAPRRGYVAPRRYTTTAPAQSGNATRLYSNGNWVVSYFAKSASGNPMCSMFHAFNGGGIAVKFTEKGGLFVEATKNHWSLSPGQQVEMSVIFDHDNAFAGTAKTGVQDGWHLTSLFLNLSAEDKASFMPSFEDADTMTVMLSGSFERPIKFGMEGSRKASEWFQTCINRISYS